MTVRYTQSGDLAFAYAREDWLSTSVGRQWVRRKRLSAAAGVLLATFPFALFFSRESSAFHPSTLWIWCLGLVGTALVQIPVSESIRNYWVKPFESIDGTDDAEVALSLDPAGLKFRTAKAEVVYFWHTIGSPTLTANFVGVAIGDGPIGVPKSAIGSPEQVDAFVAELRRLRGESPVDAADSGPADSSWYRSKESAEASQPLENRDQP